MRWTRELPNLTVHLTVQLILAALAVRYSVADPRLQDAAAVLARKLLRLARFRLLDLRLRAPLLVLPTVAVVLPVTPPPPRNTRSIVALELGRRAAAHLPWTVLLVAPVATVIVTVAPETIQDAATQTTAPTPTTSGHSCRGATPALELALATERHRRFAIVLVRSVCTVNVSVAAKGQGHALAIATLPLLGIAPDDEMGRREGSDGEFYWYCHFVPGKK